MNDNENFIIFSDVKRVFIRFKWVICAGALLFGTVGFYFRTRLPVTYEVVSTFKEAQSASSTPGEGLFETMIKSIGMGGDQKGFFIITSSLMLKPVVEKLGLQASIAPRNGWRSRLRQIRDALNAERGKPTFPEEGFVFEDVHYAFEETKKYEIFFTSKECFEVRSLNAHVLAQGQVGIPIQFENVTLTLAKIPSDITLRQCYPLRLSSIHEHVLRLREAIEVDAVKGDRSLINLTFCHRDREFGKKLLDTLMLEYEDYLIRENRRISREQIGYLEKRRDDFCAQMDSFLEDHVDYLKKSLGETGFLSLGQHLPILQEKNKDLMENLLELDNEYDNLLSLSHSSPFKLDTEVAGLQRELHVLLKHRDELGLALMGTPTPATFIAKLDALNLDELRIKTGVDKFFSPLVSHLNQMKRKRDEMIYEASEFGQLLSPDAHQLTKIQEEKKRISTLINEKKHVEMIHSYLKNQFRLLSMQEDILKQRVFHRTSLPDEFLGIDIATLKKLLLDYLQDRDGSLSKIRKLEFVKDQMGKEAVEWVSLSSTLPDSLSAEIALEMGQLVQQMRKKRSFTEKELERMERTFFEKKSNLIKHMNQTIHLQELQTDLINQRIRLVQTTMLDLLNKDIALIKQQIKDRVAERLMQVSREKAHTKEQIEQLVSEMTKIPETWLKERQLQFSSEMHKGMLESLVRLVESKNIESHLLTVESKTLDSAYAPLIPQHPKLKLITFLGFLIGMVLTFGACFMWMFYRGIPLTLENLKVRGKQVIGKLSKKISIEEKSADLEVLRRLSLLLKEQESTPLVVTLVLGTGIDYSPYFAQLLEKEGKKILVVNLDFSKKIKQKNLPGLIHYLEGEANYPMLRSKHYGTSISMGGYSPFGDEMLKSKKFHDFIDKEKQQYDVVLLALPKKARESLPKTFFSCSNVMIVKLEGECFTELLPYFHWDEGKGTVAFLS
jgi:uncharacterized protein involved in exopolysaccharide biosynthesis